MMPGASYERLLRPPPPSSRFRYDGKEGIRVPTRGGREVRFILQSCSSMAIFPTRLGCGKKSDFCRCRFDSLHLATLVERERERERQAKTMPRWMCTST